MTQKTIIIVLLLVLFSLQIYASAAELPEKIQLYKNDFSTSPDDWLTKNPTRYYWDNESKVYHYLSKGGTSGYTTVKIPLIETGFILEFDVTPIATSKNGAFRFGVGTADANTGTGPLVLVSLENTKYGNIFYLSSITDENVKTYTSSSPQDGSYGGTTIRFEDNKSYHIYVRFDPDQGRTTIRVTDPTTNEFIWGFYTDVNGEMKTGLSYLFITSVGDGLTDATAEGSIDNIDCYILDYTGEIAKAMATPIAEIPKNNVYDDVIPTLAPHITPPPLHTEIEPVTVSPKYKPVATNDTEQQTPASPPSLMIPLVSLAAGILCILYRR